MKDEFIIVHVSALPDYYERVLQAKEALQTGSVRDVSEAAAMAGISRSTFYKYRDLVFRPSVDMGRKAVFSLLLRHRAGVLSEVLALFSASGANVLTIMQSPPLGARASVVLSVDISEVEGGINGLISRLLELEGVERAELLDVE